MPIRSCRQLLCRFLLLAFMAISAACGTDSGARPPIAGTFALEGVVEDGPIADAAVFLLHRGDDQLLTVCGPRGEELCQKRSDTEGRFVLLIREGTVLENLLAVSIGGQDQETGVDFTDLEMRAPLELFPEQALVVISPLTTLLAGLLAAGQEVTATQQQVRHWLALPEAVNLAARPSADLELLRRSLLLTKIAIEFKGQQNSEEQPAVPPFAWLVGQVASSDGPLLEGDGTLRLSILELSAAAKQRIDDLYQRIAQAPEQLSSIFMQEEVVQALVLTLERMLGESALAALQQPNALHNIRALADQMLAAAGPGGIPLGGIIPQRLARYVLFSYGLQTAEPFALPPAEFAELLEGLTDDPLMAEMAQSKALFSVAAPLLGDELPGDDNDKRIAYYYGSDRSHLYQAEKLLGLVFDDVINDALMVKVVKGKAAAGLLAEARTIIATQIFQAEAKANAHRAYGNVLLAFGRPEEAITALHSAKALYFAVIEAKGKANASSNDSFNLQATAASLRKAGDLNGALEVLAYLAAVAEAMSDNTIALGRLMVGTWQVADEYLAAGDPEAAAPVVDELYRLAADFQANLVSGVWTYRQRVYYLIETAKRYATLGQSTRVLEIHQDVESLRLADGFQNFTGAESWAWIPGLVETLYRSGHQQKALALADSIPASYVDAAGNTKSGLTFQRAAFKEVVTYEALNGELQQALSMLDLHFSTDEDRIEALTYLGINKKIPHMGLALIKAGRYADAREALQRAAVLVDGLDDPDGLIKATDLARYTDLLQRGYVKIADLHAMMGDAEGATALLRQAENVIEKLSGVKYIVDGLAGAALVHGQLGQLREGGELLEWARRSADGAASLILAEDAALLYEVLLKAWIEFDDLPQAQGAIDAFLFWTRAIHLAGSGNDAAAGKEVDFLLRAGNYLLSLRQDVAALAVLAEAEATADQIYNAAARLAKYIYPKPVANPGRNHIVGGYAKARDYSRAQALATALPYTSNRNDALHYLADAYAERDDFPDTWVASIDSDGDGRPDFFNPLASAADIAASGLVLDDDCDGDGIPDRLDPRPLYPD